MMGGGITLGAGLPASSLYWKKWRTAWCNNFFVLTEDEANSWENELRFDSILCIQGLTEEQMLQAIRLMVDNEAFAVKHPKVKNLRAAIGYIKAQAHSSVVGVEKPEQGCGACNDGWISVRPTTGEYADHAVSIPCTCRMGEYWVKYHYAGREQGIRELQKLIRKDDPYATRGRVDRLP